MRIGILTGGGDSPGLNAVIRAVSKSLILQNNATIIGFEDGFLGMCEKRVRELSYRDVSGILTQGGTILGSSNKANPFSFYKQNDEDISDEAIRYCTEDLQLEAVVAIGGDGTMSMSHGLQQKGLNIVGVPKTIDNDIVGTDRTFGFDTAVMIATEALDRVHTTAQSHNRVMIVETMGRYAGWIALHSGVASGADVILIPEIDFDVEEVARICQKRKETGQRFTIITIAEGARPQGGQMAVKSIVEESHDPLRLGGISDVLAHELKKHLDSEIRAIILGHVQRGGTPTAYDRVLATSFGGYAASLVKRRQFGRMVALQNSMLTSVAFETVANKTRTIPLDSPLLSAAMGVGTSFGVPDLSPEYYSDTSSMMLS